MVKILNFLRTYIGVVVLGLMLLAWGCYALLTHSFGPERQGSLTAQLYDLDFLPVCEEQYDLLIPASAWENPAVQRLLEILKSPEFAARMQQLGGYRLERPGEVRQKF